METPDPPNDGLERGGNLTLQTRHPIRILGGMVETDHTINIPVSIPSRAIIPVYHYRAGFHSGISILNNKSKFSLDQWCVSEFFHNPMISCSPQVSPELIF